MNGSSLAKTVLGGILGFLAGLPVAVRCLLVLMGIDLATGLAKAYIAKTVSSDVSFTGLVRKVVVLLVVAAAAVASHPLGLASNLGALVAGAFCIHEFISILENAAAAGVPLPRLLVSVLEKLKKDEAS